MSPLVVDTYEGHNVEIIDFTGEYLNADIPDDKDVRLKLEGKLVDNMCNVNPYQIPNNRYKNVREVLYLSIMKALYGCIESDILWYDPYANTLKEWGFAKNPYDQCVTNKVIGGNQCMMC